VEAVEIWSGSAHDNPWDRTGRRVDGLGIDRRHLKIQDAGEAELSGAARSDQHAGKRPRSQNARRSWLVRMARRVFTPS
jgi:hypothetical protein